MSITQSHVIEAVQVYLEADIPVLMWGPPGTGKTTVANGLGTRNGWPVETVMASLREPSDFAGLPVRTDDGVILEPPTWAKRLAAHPGRSVAFFDEISTAAPATQAALLRVVLDKWCGDLHLGGQVRFIAAANEAHQAAGGWDLAAPLANRFGHLDWTVDAATVANGLIGVWPDLTAITFRDGWQTRTGHFGSIVGSFLRVRPDLLDKIPGNDRDASRAFPTPRSWERVVRVLATIEAATITDTARMLCVAGLVGDGAAAEYLAYERDLDLPDPETLLAHPASFTLPARLDRQYAVLMSVAAAVLTNPTPKRWEAGMRVCVAAVTAGVPDVAAAAAMLLARSRPTGAKVPVELAEFIPVLTQAGMIPNRP